MPPEVYTCGRETPTSAALPDGGLRRAGDLLPELFRQYALRVAAADARRESVVPDGAAPPLGISIVAVKSAGCAIATGVSATTLPIAAPAAIQS